jgi:hypothetical protein
LRISTRHRYYEEYSLDELNQKNFYKKLLALKKEQEEHLKLGKLTKLCSEQQNVVKIIVLRAQEIKRFLVFYVTYFR